MHVQKSFEATDTGTLYVVPTPIGNLEDITYRALKVLESAAVIAAEDTRHTRQLLTHFDIKTPFVSYHEHSNQNRGQELLNRLDNGETIAVVSDAGMPAISDPGQTLIEAAITSHYSVVVLPGANAALCALIGSGLPTSEFTFIGFLPRKQKDRRQMLKRLKYHISTLIFYESPYRVKDTLQAMVSELGNRRMVLARELTKKFEEYSRGTAEELIDWISDQQPKGEFCIVVEGAYEQEAEAHTWWQDWTIKAHVNHYVTQQGMSSKTAIKQVALDRKRPKREVYQAYHID